MTGFYAADFKNSAIRNMVSSKITLIFTLIRFKSLQKIYRPYVAPGEHPNKKKCMTSINIFEENRFLRLLCVCVRVGVNTFFLFLYKVPVINILVGSTCYD